MSEFFGRETPVIVGTAGHVDHGKSALVLALTGTDPDRLPQEKARGITIDLGFANLKLPGGHEVGLVDVPGHEHYVRAMVAGATGVDVALLVIAADDGIMPQTREHLRILELVGVKHMVVALTKCDLIDDPDWLGLVQADIEEFLGTTTFAGSAVIPVSARTGMGVEDVARALEDQVESVLASGVVERRLGLPARLPVDRAFNLAGIGAVVTGTLRSGSMKPGDAVEIVPGAARAKIRSIQVHGLDVDEALAGQRTAVNLAGLSLEDVPRGCTVGAPGALEAHDRFDAQISWLGREDSPEPLTSGERVHVCTGTSEALGRILLFDGAETIMPGETVFAQIRLEEPLVVRAHDRFVVMAYSPVELVGGGEVLLSRVARRTSLSSAEHALLKAQAKGDINTGIISCVDASLLPLYAADIEKVLDEPPARVEAMLSELVAAGSVCSLPCGQDGFCYTTSQNLAECLKHIESVLSEAAKDPHHEGLPALTLRDKSYPRASEEVFSALIDAAIERGIAKRFGSNVASAAVVERLQKRLDGLAQTVESALEKKGIAALFTDELAPELGISPDEVLRGMRTLVEQGKAERIEKNYYLASSAFEQACTLVRKTIEPTGSATASELREALGLSRKYALPLLEHLDRIGLTERDPADQNLRKLHE
ncbi:MAG: selenocysteine-specific translation elongation factor [Coriobacteriales bacterium]|nr:selenocysteine-specific translation elongation factor [Coriobacteriales bacterium]